MLLFIVGIKTYIFVFMCSYMANGTLSDLKKNGKHTVDLSYFLILTFQVLCTLSSRLRDIKEKK